MIAIGVEHPGKKVQATVDSDFYNAFLGVTNIIFAYGGLPEPLLPNIATNETNLSAAGHVAFFSFISELRDPQDFPKALYLLQFADTAFYVVSAIVIYRFGGQGVASPALGSTSPVLSKVAYGIAIPTVLAIFQRS